SGRGKLAIRLATATPMRLSPTSSASVLPSLAVRIGLFNTLTNDGYLVRPRGLSYPERTVLDYGITYSRAALDQILYLAPLLALYLFFQSRFIYLRTHGYEGADRQADITVALAPQDVETSFIQAVVQY